METINEAIDFIDEIWSLHIKEALLFAQNEKTNRKLYSKSLLWEIIFPFNFFPHMIVFKTTFRHFFSDFKWIFTYDGFDLYNGLNTLY